MNLQDLGEEKNLVKFKWNCGSVALEQSRGVYKWVNSYGLQSGLRILFPWKLQSEDKRGMLCPESLYKALRQGWKSRLLVSVKVT